MNDTEREQFCNMLHVSEVPEKLEQDFDRVKLMKDTLHAGPMTAGEMAILAFVSGAKQVDDSAIAETNSALTDSAIAENVPFEVEPEPAPVAKKKGKKKAEEPVPVPLLDDEQELI
jgi:hypothetical protein